MRYQILTVVVCDAMMIVTSAMEEHTATSYRVEETKIQTADSSEMDPV